MSSYTLGLEAIQKGDIPTAIQYFQQSSQENPSDFASWNLLGVSHQLSQQWAEADKAWTEALRCNPASIDTLLNLGVANIALGLPHKAEKYWSQIIAQDPNHIASLINLGLVYRERQENRKAHDMWQRAFDLYPHNKKLQEWLADVKGLLGAGHIAMREYKKAQTFLEDAIHLDPDYPVLWGYLTELHFIRKEYKQALATCHKALELDANNSDVHHTMGNIMRMAGEDREALLSYKKAVELGGKHPATFRAIAELSGDNQEEDEKVIELLFDQYALDFDHELQENLHYNTPMVAWEFFQQTVAVEKYMGNACAILDLGCGTGLSIVPFREYLQSKCTLQDIVGVDLSKKMLQEAKKKQLYTELHHLSFKEYTLATAQTSTRFDLVLCLDAVVYIKNLEAFLIRAGNCVREGAHFVFSTEDSTGMEPMLQYSGRYAHPVEYVQRILVNTSWQLLGKNSTFLRKDAERWVQGTIWILQYQSSTVAG
jgi:predicted TPR repeat methyltransferase